MAALDLAGVFFNIRMLRSCLKDRTKYTFLQKCRALVICQFAYQVTILVTNAVESWQLLLDIQPRECCYILRVLSISMMFFQACNLTVILIIHSDYSMANGIREASSNKLKISAVVSLGFIGSAMIWYSSLTQQFNSQMAVIISVFVVTMMFVIFMYAAVSMTIDNIHDELEDTIPEASMKACSLMWKVCKVNKRYVFFITFLLTCLAVFSSGLPRSGSPLGSQDFAQTEVFKERLYSFITQVVFGIILPVTISEMIIDSSHEEEHEKEVVII